MQERSSVEVRMRVRQAWGRSHTPNFFSLPSSIHSPRHRSGSGSAGGWHEAGDCNSLTRLSVHRYTADLTTSMG
jgi:hypothetical protein